jgi:hypothetical protein
MTTMSLFIRVPRIGILRTSPFGDSAKLNFRSSGMYVSSQQARCLRQLMLGKGFACHNCGSGSFIIKSARWSMTSLPALDVASICADCGTEATSPLSLQEARRCGFDDPYERVRQDVS